MGTILTPFSITNGLVTVGVDANMRAEEISKGGFNLWAKSVDILTYVDTVSLTTKSVTMKNLTWSIASYASGSKAYIQGLASYTDVDGVLLNFDFRYYLTDGSDNVQLKMEIDSDTEIRLMRGVHYGRANTNVINRNPRVVFQKGVEIDYVEYANDTALQTVWTGDVTPIATADSVGGDSTYAIQASPGAGAQNISRTIAGENWTESQYLLLMINTQALTGSGHKVRLWWVSNGTTYYTPYRTIDAGEPYKTDWKLRHMRHFYLDSSDRSNVTQFGIEFSGGGGTFIVDEIWRYKKDDYLPAYSASNTDFYDNLPFFNAASVTWDRRQSEETFVLSYADETGVGGDMLGIAWIGHWSRTTDIVTVEFDSASNANPLNIGGHVKYLCVGLSGLKWKADWYILPMAEGMTATAMYNTAKSLYNGLISKGYTSNTGTGDYSFMPYIWPRYDDPIVDLAPDLRRAAAAGITDLILPMGNNGWHAFKPRNARFDCANVVKEKADDRLEFVINMWLDPAYPERRVHLEATIFDNHWLKDNLDEVTVKYDTTQGDDRMFVYASSTDKELYISRAYEPIETAWFDDQVVDGVTYTFSYQYPRFRPSLAYIVKPGADFGKVENLHDRLMTGIGEVCDRHDFTSIVLSEYFWYRRAFDNSSLDLYNIWRQGQELDTLPDFDRIDNNLPASVSNIYEADDIHLWQWKSSEVTGLMSDIKAIVTGWGKLVWVNSNVDNIIDVKDKTHNLWAGVGMLSGLRGPVPTGKKSLQWDNARHGTDFDVLNDDANVDIIWCWNYWGYSRTEAILEFIVKYCKKKSKISMALGIYPMSAPPSAADFETAIKQARQYGFKLSFPGHRNYTEAHWLALEAGLAASVTSLSCPVATKKVLGKRRFSNLDMVWEEGEWEKIFEPVPGEGRLFEKRPSRSGSLPSSSPSKTFNSGGG